jgi:hypothetical protein
MVGLAYRLAVSVRRGEAIVIFHHRRVAVANEDEQHLMARPTGNDKRGNERTPRR